MLSILLLLQSSTPNLPQDLPTFDEVKARDCAALVAADPASAIVNAGEWTRANGGHRAAACLGSAYAALGKFTEASAQFVLAANSATSPSTASAPSSGGTQASQYWAQAGNAALAASLPNDAVQFLGRALNFSVLTKPVRANILIDRARAYVAAGDPENAKADLAEVRRIAPDNAPGWLLSATLARRMGTLADAQNFIITAAGLSSGDASVALEAGNIAVTAGAFAVAREQWQQVLRLAPDSAQAATAKALLAQLAEQGLENTAPSALPLAQPSIATPDTR